MGPPTKKDLFGKVEGGTRGALQKNTFFKGRRGGPRQFIIGCGSEPSRRQINPGYEQQIYTESICHGPSCAPPGPPNVSHLSTLLGYF